MSCNEKSDTTPFGSQSEEVGRDYVETVHADGAVDLVDARALGGSLTEMPSGYFYSFAFLGTFFATCLASICAYLGWVLPANTLDLINEDIGPSADIGWVGTAWTVGSSIGFLLFGRMSDIFGRRWIVILNMVLGLVGCIVGAVAPNVNTLIGASTCNGLSSAGQLSFAIILGELVSNKHRGPIVTLCFLSSLPFAVFGPVIARSLITNTAQGWRWSFYIGIILSVITLVLYYLSYHPPSYEQLHVQGKPKRQQMMELDYGGIFLFIAGTVLFLVGLSWGGTTRPWADAGVISTIVIGVMTLVAFALYEQYVVKHQPLMPPRLFKNLGFVAIAMVACIGAMVYYSMTVLWPTAINTIFTTDPVKVGWQSSVVGGGMLLGQVMGGLALSYVPKLKLQMIFASCVACAFFGALASISEDKHAAFIVIGIIGIAAAGFVEGVAFPGITLVSDAQDIGLATGVMGSLRAMSGAIAQALYASILNTKLTGNLESIVVPAATGAGLPKSSIPTLMTGIAAGDFSMVEGMTPHIMAVVSGAVKTAYTHSFQIVFYATIPFSAVLIAGSILVPNMEKYLGDNVAKRLQARSGNGKPATVDSDKNGDAVSRP